MSSFSWGTTFRGFRGGSDPRILVTTKQTFSGRLIKEITMATKFEPYECVIFVQSTKIGTHEDKGIHSRIL